MDFEDPVMPNRPRTPWGRDNRPMGYREPGDPIDDRPLIRHGSVWDRCGASERLEYEHAVETNPKAPGETPLAYIRRIAELVAGRRLTLPADPEDAVAEMWAPEKRG